MDTALPVAVPPLYESRRGWLMAFGVIEILIGCLFLLMILVMILFSQAALLGPAGANMPSGPYSSRGPMIFVCLQYGLMAAVFFTGGIGSIRCKNWARILMLIVSGIWLGIGLLSTLVMVFLFPVILRQQPVHSPPEIQRVIMVVMIAFMTLFLVVLPAIFLFFYSRRSVRATCLAARGDQAGTLAAEGTSAAGFPVPLAILGACEALGALAVCATLFVPATFVFGVVLHGPSAVLVLLAHSILSAYAAWSIFRRKLIGWSIAMLKAGLWAVSLVVSYLRHPDLLQLYREMGLRDQALRVYEQFPQILSVFWVGMIVGMTVFLVFILYSRKFFPTEERA